MINIIIPNPDSKDTRDFKVVHAESGQATSLVVGDYYWQLLPEDKQHSVKITNHRTLTTICDYYKFKNRWIDGNGYISAFDVNMNRVNGYVYYFDPNAPAPDLDYDDLEDAVALLEAQLEAMRAEVNRLSAELTASRNTVSELQLTLQTSQANLIAAQNQLADKEAELASKTVELATAQQQIVTLQEQLQTANQNLANANATNADLEYELAVTTGDLNTARAQVSTLQGQVSSLQNDVNALTISRDALSLQLATKTEELNTANARISVLESDLSELNGQIASMNAQLGSLNLQVEQLTADKTDLEAQLVAKDAELSNKELELIHASAANGVLESKNDELQNEVDQLTADKMQLENDISALEESKTSLETQIAGMQSYMSEMGQEMIRLNEENRDLSADVTKLTEEAAWNANITTSYKEEILRLEGLLYHTPVVMSNAEPVNSVNYPTDVIIMTADPNAGPITAEYEVYGYDIKMHDVEIAPECNLSVSSAGALRLSDVSIDATGTTIEGFWSLHGTGHVALTNCDFDGRSTGTFLTLALLANSGNPSTIDITNCKFDSATDTMGIDVIESNSVVTFKNIKFYFGGTNSTFLSFRNMNNATNLHFIFENCEFADFGYNKPLISFEGDPSLFGPSNLQITIKNCSAYADNQFLTSAEDLSNYIGSDASDRQFFVITNSMGEALPYASNQSSYPTFNLLG